MPQDNTTISSDPSSSYEAARSSAVISPRRDRGWIVVSGNDRASYLQGLFTNDIAALKTGEGCYACYLTPQGRMITDVVVDELGDAILLSLGSDVKDAVLAKLDQFIFSEDVQLGDVSDRLAGFVVAGARAAEAIAAVFHLDLDRLVARDGYGNLRAPFVGEQAIVLSTREFGVSAYEILIEREHGDALRAAFSRAGAIDAGEEALETIRIESGVPKFHRDMDEETIPLEAGLEENAISFSKGCYVGQEVIIRVMHRGHGRVARRLVGIIVDSEGVAPGTIVAADGHDIGRVTSAAFSPALQKHIALGYLHRDYVEPGTKVTAGGVPAVVAKLPFVKTQA